jgi:hypothetical protein
MKNIIKQTLKLGAGIGLAFSLLTTSAHAQGSAIFSTNLSASATNSIITNACYISEIDLISGSGTVSTLNFYDSIGGTNTYAFTNSYVTRVTVFTNIVSVLTNGMGTVYTNTYPGEYTSLVTNAAATNTLPIIMTFSSVANTRQARSPLRIVCTKGLTVVTDAAGTNQTVIVYYAYPF